MFFQNEGEKESSTSESSLESSSGYGSQTTFPVDDTQHMDGKANQMSFKTVSRHAFLFLNRSFLHFMITINMKKQKQNTEYSSDYGTFSSEQ